MSDVSSIPVLKVRRNGEPRRGLLARMRIRKKLIFLHTAFSLILAGIVLIFLRPAVGEVLRRAELDEGRALLSVIARSDDGPISAPDVEATLKDVRVKRGTSDQVGLDSTTAAKAQLQPGQVVVGEVGGLGEAVVVFRPARGERPPEFVALRVESPEARRALVRLYVFATAALLGVYALVAIALEIFVLPANVYEPIRRILAADRATRDGRTPDEIIPPSQMPADELGEIMRSRNETVSSLRQNQAALGDALRRLEEVANDLARKNLLLETAKRNLADADRLASLGMMSAGISHELNTPLAVLKGLVEKLNADPARGIDPAQAALMLRVVKRLERLGESLLDFARARPKRSARAEVRPIIAEAATLVALDREIAGVEIVNDVPAGLHLSCDADRLVQVFVNLIRNAADAIKANELWTSTRPPARPARIAIAAESASRDGAAWVALTVTDDGPGIDPTILPRLFEPFASTRLDARGTGLGLAVAEGIVREHGGFILARNRAGANGETGAVFEVLLPADEAGG